MRHLSLVLGALLLAAACSGLQAAPRPAISACTTACVKAFNDEIQDCVDKADMTRALQPVAGDQEAMAMPASARAARPSYAGPQVDVLEAVKEQCRRNIGTTKLNTCLKACLPPPPVIVRPVPKPTLPPPPVIVRPVPKDCMEVCRARFLPSTLGRLRCMYNCP